MTPEEGADILTRAADLLLIDGWCQGQLHDDAGRHCMVGAIEAAWCEANGDDWHRYVAIGFARILLNPADIATNEDWIRHLVDTHPLRTAVGKAIDHKYIPEFNDHHATDEFQAADALKSAAKGLANGEIEWTWRAPC